MTSVKYFHSAMPNAPVLNGTAGSLIGVLDACLVNGFGLAVVDTLTVTDGIATASMSLGHSFEPDTVALITGASVPALNGQFRVLTTTTNTITFATTAPNGSATGTMSARLAPAGWEKPFSGTNLAVYRSLNLTGTRCFFRLDDSAAQNGRLVGYESMSDVNTGTGLFPTAAQLSGGFWWPKASSTATTARAWTVVASDRTVWYWANTHLTPASHGVDGVVFGFGDFNSFKSGDAYSAFALGHTADISASSAGTATHAFYAQQTSTAAHLYCPRAYTAIGSSMGMFKRAESYNRTEAASGTPSEFPYPNGPDNALLLSRMLVYDTSGNHLRGVLPGLYFVPQLLTTTAFSWRDKVNGQGPLAGRKLLAVKSNGGAASTTLTNATGFFDITGPW